jgi:hypothetical protein
MFLSKYGVARHLYVPLIKRGVVDFAVGADFSPAAGDVKISKDGGASANVTNLPTAITMGNTAMWDFSLTATEMQAAQIVVMVADSATKAVEDQTLEIETYGNASAQHEFDLDTPTVVAASVTGSVGSVATGGIAAASFAAGAIDAAAIATDAIGSAELATTAVNEIRDAILSDSTSFAGASIAAIKTRTDAMPVTIRSGTAQAGTASSITLDASASATDGTYITLLVLITGGTGVGQCRLVTSYTGSTKVITVAPSWITNPDATSTFMLLAWGGVDVEMWELSTPNALSSGRVDSRVGAMSANTITSAVIATDAITAAAIATDAIGSAELAASAVTEIQSGLATSASISALNNLSAAQVNAEVVDALNVDTYAEPGQAAPGATVSLATKISYLYKAWRNRTTQTTTEYNLYGDDATTVDQKASFSDNGTTADRGEIATGP